MNGSEWDPEAISRLNQRVETAQPNDLSGEELFPEAEEVESHNEGDGQALDSLTRQDEAATRKPAYMDEIESWAEGNEGNDWGEDEINGVGDLVAQLVGDAKDFLNKVSKQKIRQKVREAFTEKQIPLIELVIFLEMEGKMNSASAEVMKDWAAKYNTTIPELVTVYVKYRELKEDLEVGKFQDWQKTGIRKYTIDTLKKYVNGRVPAELLLGLYLFATLGWDTGKLAWYFWQEKREKREKNETQRQ